MLKLAWPRNSGNLTETVNTIDQASCSPYTGSRKQYKTFVSQQGYVDAPSSHRYNPIFKDLVEGLMILG